MESRQARRARERAEAPRAPARPTVPAHASLLRAWVVVAQDATTSPALPLMRVAGTIATLNRDGVRRVRRAAARAGEGTIPFLARRAAVG